uniref:Uncharacterized protein n=1 Tax=Anguilla anguilla TaxID=7936 RepID=A0A0E9X137_ANGAN
MCPAQDTPPLCPLSHHTQPYPLVPYPRIPSALCTYDRAITQRHFSHPEPDCLDTLGLWGLEHQERLNQKKYKTSESLSVH